MSFSAKLLKLTKQLYPTGRAFWMPKNGIFEKIHDALTLSESLAIEKLKTIYDSILADNENFTESDATNWERALGLFNQNELTLAIRKQSILRRYKHPGGILYRQSALYLQGQLQDAGFNVYVHENRPTLYQFVSAIYGQVQYGQVNYGDTSIVGYTIVANSLDEIEDSTFNLGNSDNQKELFFIGGSTFPNSANVDFLRKKEFRELILKIKPAHTVAILLINYVSLEFGIGYAEIGIDFSIE
jgi:hypothetical protein